MSYSGDIRLGRAIRRARKIRGMSQHMTAVLAGLQDRSVVAQWENAHRAVALKRWERVTEALGIEFKDLTLKTRGTTRFVFAGPYAQVWLWAGNNRIDLLSSEHFSFPQLTLPGVAHAP